MRRFELAEPSTLEEAAALLNHNREAKVIAGGTALLTLIKNGIFIPKHLINLNKIKTAGDISFDVKKGLRIGALAAIYDVEASPLVRQHCAVLAEACHVVANIRIRNMATIGGNLAHADHQSDPATVLVALDASVELVSPAGTRQMKLSEFLRGSYETALEPSELISALIVPPSDHLRGTYVKFTTGSSEERPCAGIAVLTKMENNLCAELRLVVGAVSPKPIRVHTSESMARGARFSDELIQRIAVDASGSVDPIDDLRATADYKRHLVRVLVSRALRAAAQA